MCGIYGLLKSNITPELFDEIKRMFMDNNNRGPDNSTINIYENIDSVVGFHRLSINGLDDGSNQPIIINNKLLICNGEIYNHKQFYNENNIIPKTNSDCESIIYMYEKMGIEQALQYMDGVFSFMLYDFSNKDKVKLFIARDPYGVRPLFKFNVNGLKINDENLGNDNSKVYGFSSEMKYFYNKCSNNRFDYSDVKQFTPGTYMKFEYSNVNGWIPRQETTYHNVYTIQDTILNDKENLTDIEKQITTQIKNTLLSAVKKRVDNTDRPIACLLSGGLDSSLITSIVHKYYSNDTRVLETYSIGMEGGEDLKYAKMVADFLGTKHTTIVVSEEDFLNAIPEVITVIESYDTTTIRASVGNYLVSKYISQNSDAKVIFNGDGSDEVTGGYMYFHYSPDAVSFDNECKRLLKDIHYFDVLRSDRSISNNGLEARTPFLDKRFVQYYLSIPKNVRFQTHKTQCEKYLLREAFNDGSFLPDNVLWRTKEAFSDGVSSHNRSWYQIIQEHIRNNQIIEHLDMDKYGCIDIIKNTILKNKFKGITGNHKSNIQITDEQLYYYCLFSEQYSLHGDIPYYWMPKFINATDASARTLDVYKK